jgi:hypothetical protein
MMQGGLITQNIKKYIMNPYEPIFSEIANGLLEVAEIKPNYSDNAMLDVTLIFQSVFMDKLFDNQNFDNMSMEDRTNMAKKAGEDLRKLIHTYTGLDTHKLVNKI